MGIPDWRGFPLLLHSQTLCCYWGTSSYSYTQSREGRICVTSPFSQSIHHIKFESADEIFISSAFFYQSEKTEFFFFKWLGRIKTTTEPWEFRCAGKLSGSENSIRFFKMNKYWRSFVSTTFSSQIRHNVVILRRMWNLMRLLFHIFTHWVKIRATRRHVLQMVFEYRPLDAKTFLLE